MYLLRQPSESQRRLPRGNPALLIEFLGTNLTLIHRIAAKLATSIDLQRKSPEEIQKQSQVRQATAQQKRQSLATTKVTRARQSVEKVSHM